MQYTIIGGGRIGHALDSIAEHSVLVCRGEPIPDLPGPIIVCTRNDDLAAVVAAVSSHRRADLVFVQNGMVESWLDSQGLSDASQALLYFAVSKVGAQPQDGGGSVVRGPRAAEFAALLHRGGLQCTVVERSEYRRQMAEKFLWNCIFGVLCDHFDCTVGEAVQLHKEALTELTVELASQTFSQLGEEWDLAIVDRLCDYSLTIPDYRAAVKEWSWRNGWLWDLGPGPVHRRLLGAEAIARFTAS